MITIRRIPSELLAQHSIRPLVENRATCYILRIPARENYTVTQQNLILGLSQECLNDISKGDGLTFVIPFGLSYEEELWNEIMDEFGVFVFVEKVC